MKRARWPQSTDQTGLRFLTQTSNEWALDSEFSAGDSSCSGQKQETSDLMNGKTESAFLWLLERVRKPRARRAVRRAFQDIESLEPRVVLVAPTTVPTPTSSPTTTPSSTPTSTPTSTSAPAAPPSILLGALGIVGVVPACPPPPLPAGVTPSAQLTTDTQKLKADSLAIQANSGVNVSEMTAILQDEQTIIKAGVVLDPKAVLKVTDGIARGVLANNTTTAKADFAALFGTTLTSAVIDKIFADMVRIVKDSKITLAQLNTIAADNAAIQKDLTALGVKPPPPPAPPAAPTGTPTQLDKDTQKLRQDVMAIQSTSLVTVASLTALGGDDQAIIAAGIKLDGKALLKATDALVRAVLNGNPAPAKQDFAALFGTKLTSAAIDKAFNDMVKIVRDSKITLAQLNTIAADNAAIQADLTAAGTTAPTPPPPSLAGALAILGVIPAPPGS